MLDDSQIRSTIAALDRALARITLRVAGSRTEADKLLTILDHGETSAAARAFLAEGAAMIRARMILAEALGQSTGQSLRKVA